MTHLQTLLHGRHPDTWITGNRNTRLKNMIDIWINGASFSDWYKMCFLFQGICYVTDMKVINSARKLWESQTNNAIVEYIVVSGLPRNALVEWHVWAHRHNNQFECKFFFCLTLIVSYEYMYFLNINTRSR